MKRSRHTVSQIITKLRQAEADASAGMDTAVTCKKLAISAASYHRWRQQYGGMKAEEAKRLKELEEENRRLKKLLAEAELDKAILKEALEGN